jgi:hypothetical protein
VTRTEPSSHRKSPKFALSNSIFNNATVGSAIMVDSAAGFGGKGGCVSGSTKVSMPFVVEKHSYINPLSSMLFQFRRRETPWEVVDNSMSVEPVPMYYEDEGNVLFNLFFSTSSIHHSSDELQISTLIVSITVTPPEHTSLTSIVSTRVLTFVTPCCSPASTSFKRWQSVTSTYYYWKGASNICFVQCLVLTSILR